MDKEKIQEVQKDCDDYKHTVWALLALANHVSWDDKNKRIDKGCKYSLGRRMTVKEGDPVTPDLSIQKSEEYGLVVEAKKDLPLNQTFWDKPLQQLIKYDIIIEGWISTNKVNNYDIVFLTDLSRAVRFGDFVQDSKQTFSHNLAIIAFEPTTETFDTFITLKREWGEITDSDLNESLRIVTKVSLTNIENSIGKIKFYDSRPPVPYLTQIFWMHICNSLIGEETWNSQMKAHVLNIKIDEITDKFQQYYGQKSMEAREQEIPKKKWIKEMFDFLVFCHYAKELTEEGTYMVLWKEFRDDILERFCKDWIKYQGKEPEATVSSKGKSKLQSLFE
jgi:hypothetical protein